MTVIPIGSEFQVNTFTTDFQSNPSVAVDRDGDFIITWESRNQDGNALGIYAQRYNADGTTNGSEFQVNTFTTGDQREPSVAVDEDGDFIITWISNGQDGDLGGIYAQRYNADGTTNGSEFQVNTFTTGNQITPSVAVDEDDEFIITWQSTDEQDGDDGGIYAQRFTGNNSPIVANPTVDQTIVPVSNFSFTVSPNTFEDADSDPLTLSATLENGDTLPDWLNFDNSTGTFTGFPTSSDIGTISVSVTADDGGPGTPAVDTFDLTVEFSNTPNTTINISGDGSNNTINGTSANELIRGRAGNDLLDGSGGDDFIQGGNGADEIRGSSGNDLLIGNRGDDLLIGGQGDDTLVGSNNRDTLLGGAANDILDGGNGIDELQGDDGNDQLFGGNGKDNLFGGAGNDQFFLIAGTGDDNIRDFEDGIDSFVLGVGITFSDLDISDNLSGDTVIRLAGQRLATVSNTAASLIDASDFTNF
ncbi:MAG: putative Ig domain-containing protein [Cyanobacteria bacterium P01_D01_bin.116]